MMGGAGAASFCMDEEDEELDASMAPLAQSLRRVGLQQPGANDEEDDDDDAGMAEDDDGEEDEDEFDEDLLLDGSNASGASSASAGSVVSNLGAMPVAELAAVLQFLDVPSLLSSPVAVCRLWSTAVVHAHAGLVASAAVASDDDACAGGGGGLDGLLRDMGGPGGPGGRNGNALVRSMKMPNDLTSAATRGGAVPLKGYPMLCLHMPWGAFLSEGAYKRVYRVVNAHKSQARSCLARGDWQQEAVSVMDVAAIKENGAGSVVEQELKVSLLVSALVRRGDCPNFVETYGVFGADFSPPPDLWGSEDRKVPRALPTFPAHATTWPAACKPLVRPRPKKKQQLEGRHQYIRMELCDGGDLEEYIHGRPGELIDIPALRPLAFQMVFSLYAAQKEFDMRHYDVKLLNFLLKRMPECVRPSGDGIDDGGEEEEERETTVCYGVCGQRFVLRFPAGCDYGLWVKLGDYGTCDCEQRSLGQPVGLEQFTTLENAPVEQLLLGSGATQTFAADTWALGLSLLHLFTGHAPYEELLADVTCPAPLRDAVEAAWTTFDDSACCGGETNDVDQPFAVVAEVHHMDRNYDDDDEDDVVKDIDVDGEEEREEGTQQHTLADTLYRYLVLFGLPTPEEHARVEAWQGNPVWDAIHHHLPIKRRGGRISKVAKAFQKHRAEWGFECGELVYYYYFFLNVIVRLTPLRSLLLFFKPSSGTNAIMASARERLSSLGGMDLLKGMMSFDATARPTMLEALGSPLFAPMRETMSSNGESGGGGSVGESSRRPRRGQLAAAPAAFPDRCDYEFMKYMS